MIDLQRTTGYDPKHPNSISKPEQPKSECKCLDCNLPDVGIEKLGYKPVKSSRATEGKTTPIIEPKTKGKNSEVPGQPLCHQTMTSRECIGCSIDAVGECPLDNKPEQSLKQPSPLETVDSFASSGTEQPKCKTCKGFGDKYDNEKGIMVDCPDCEPKPPNQNLMIIKTIQGLMSVIEHNLSKLQKAIE